MTQPHTIRVVGVPRSGTAFASMLLQLYPECNAYHELAAYNTNWKKVITDNDADIVADCNTYGFLEQAFIPSNVKVFLQRDKWTSRRSVEMACKVIMDQKKYDTMYSLATMWSIKNDAHIFEDGEIFTIKGMERLWHLAFGEYVDFPTEKAEQLLRLNVQVNHPEKIVYEGREFIL